MSDNVQEQTINLLHLTENRKDSCWSDRELSM